MSDWSGGFAGDRPAGAKIPVKVHRHVALVRTDEPLVADELLARPKLHRLIVGRLTPNVLLVRPGKVADLVDEIRKMGHTPQVIGLK